MVAREREMMTEGELVKEGESEEEEELVRE